MTPMTPGGSRLLSRLGLTVLALALLWLGGFLNFASQLPRQENQGPGAGPESGDAIVVLTGGTGRLRVGLRLLAARSGGRPGGRLLISGVKSGISAAELQTRQTQAAGLFSCCIDLGYQARDTQGNAIETALWMHRHGFHSLQLVTASYHMPRSLLLFQQAMPDVTLRPVPVFPTHVKLAQWWLFPGTMKLLAVEYSKYLLSLLQVRLIGPVG
jgi:uncharacterized SAM-binding protein YcdF (DUF218 family)